MVLWKLNNNLIGGFYRLSLDIESDYHYEFIATFHLLYCQSSSVDNVENFVSLYVALVFVVIGVLWYTVIGVFWSSL